MKQNYFASIIMVAVFLFTSTVFSQNSETIGGAMELKISHMDESPPMRDIKAFTDRKSTYAAKEIKNKFDFSNRKDYGASDFTSDPAVQDYIMAVRSGSPTVDRTYEGVSNAENESVRGGRITPPDTQGDVGPNHYVQMTNLLTKIFDLNTNTLVAGPFPNSNFWTGFTYDGIDFGARNDGDPIVLYDQFEDRWIVSQFQTADDYVLIAVSSTPDPTGTYYRYAIAYPDFPDYPKFGIWNDAIYITTRDFLNGASFIGSSVAGIEKAGLYAGTGANGFIIPILNSSYSHDGILPADADGPIPPPAGTPHFSMFKPYGSHNYLYLAETTPDWANPANSTMTISTVPVASYLSASGLVYQPNGTGVHTHTWALMYRLQYRNFGTHQTMVANHTVKATSAGAFGIRWYEFRAPSNTSTWTTYQQGTFLPNDGENRWMGSIAMNGQGDIALGYSLASSSTHPSIRFTGQSAYNSGTGVMDLPETSIYAGTASQNHYRWGDYSMMSVDPVGDEKFWYTTEYAVSTTAWADWATKIAELSLDAPDGPAMIAVTPSSFIFNVAPNASDSDLLNIANTALAGAEDLEWTITFADPPPPSALEEGNDDGNTNFIYSSNPYLPVENVSTPTILSEDDSGNNFSTAAGEVRYTTPDNEPVLIAGDGGDVKALSSASVTITHSSDQSLIQFNSVSCNAGGLHTDNSYWRTFVLSDFGITDDFDVTDVEIGIETAAGATGDQPVTVNLYTTDGAFPTGVRTLIGTASYSVPDQALTLLNLPVTGIAPAGSELVVEIFTPEGQTDGNSFFIGSNNLGQTDESYLSAADCGATTPTDVATLGFPGMHIVMNVTGDAGPGACPWLSVAPTTGTTAAGSNEDVTVSVDATGLADGTYECQLNITSNADNASTVVVPVTMIVGSITPDPIAHWALDETSGTTAFDGSGNNLHGALVNGGQWEPGGIINGAVSLDGINDYVDIPDNDLLDPGAEDFTVSFWVFKRSTTKSWDNNWGVNKWNTGATPGSNEWSLGIGAKGNTDRPTFTIQSGTTSYGISSSENISLNEWHLITGVREGEEIKLYVNGVLMNTKAIGSVSVNNVGRNVRIANSHMNRYYTDGMFDDVRIYDFALSAEEVLELNVLENEAPIVDAGPDQIITLPVNFVNLNGTVTDDELPPGSSLTTVWRKISGPGNVVFGDSIELITTATFSQEGNFKLALFANDGLLASSDTMEVIVLAEPPVGSDIVAHWALNETSGTIVIDSSGNNLHGVLLNGGQWDPGGVIDGAVSLDGINDYIDIPDNDLLDPGAEDFTVSFWVFKRTTSTGWDNIWGVNKWNTGASPGTNEWALGIGSGGNSNRPSFAIQSGTTSYGISSNANISLNAWHLITGVREGEQIKLYVNGVLMNTRTIGSVPVNNVGRNVRIANSHMNRYYTDGMFDDVRIYGRALSGAEILALMVAVPASSVGDITLGGEGSYEDLSTQSLTNFDELFKDDIQLKNYPNPFNGSTTITFTLTETENTTLKVYDTYGKLVATLFDGMAESGQKYTLEFSAGNLPKGIYVYHLQSGNNVSVVKKMILMK